MRVCQFRHFGTVKAGALNATLTSSVMPFPLGLQMNCNTRLRSVESLAESQAAASRPRPSPASAASSTFSLRLLRKAPLAGYILAIRFHAVELLLYRQAKLVWGKGRILCRSGLPVLLPQIAFRNVRRRLHV